MADAAFTAGSHQQFVQHGAFAADMLPMAVGGATALQGAQLFFQRLQALQALETALSELVGRCGTAKRKVNCPLIAALMVADDGLTV